MSVPVDLYYTDISAPCRAVLLTAESIGLKFNKKVINLSAGEQHKPEFLALNPQHCVPTMVDGDLILWESRPICSYLASQYGNDDSLYPKDPKKRAEVDRFLYFDMGTFYHRWGKFMYPPAFKGQQPDHSLLEPVREACGWLDSWLEGKDYVTGSNVTVADFSLIASLTTMTEMGFNIDQWKNLSVWAKLCKDLPGYHEANHVGAAKFGAFVKSKLQL
ncbi:unnamed protein product [Meganyctiphanes norvegica]|uniref:Uncharacterized protein n=1 Tax=Meganyctiphanes norvegica TaxID=48144 RepID=A0AAV2S1W3_MEGNR